MMAAPSLKDMAQAAVQTNKEHQYALKVYAERLEAELKIADKLLAVAEADEDEPPVDVAGSVQIPGARKPLGLLSSAELSSESSPFHDDAMRRQRYIALTEIHPMKSKELEVLAEAVRLENYRLRAYEAQRKGEVPFFNPRETPRDLEINVEGLDWERVASKVVSDSSAIVQRTAQECKIRWLGGRHPHINHSQWTPSEVIKAKELVEGIEGDVDWVDIAKQLGTNRTPIDVMRHTMHRKTHSWNSSADKRLLDAVKIYGTENWALVARTVGEDATAAGCQKRYFRTLDPTITRGSWSPEEDDLLRLAVELYGHAWTEISSIIPGRTNEQCRDRWSERLNPNVTKGKWTGEEDAKLLAAVEDIGQSQWKEVSERVGTGRTDNMCRYRYETLKKRQEAGDTSASDSPAPAAPKARASKGKNRSAVSGDADTELGTAVAQASGSKPSAKPRPRPRPRTKVAKGKHTELDEALAAAETSTRDEVASQQSVLHAKPRPKPRLVKKTPKKTVSGASPASIKPIPGFQKRSRKVRTTGKNTAAVNAAEADVPSQLSEPEQESEHDEAQPGPADSARGKTNLESGTPAQTPVRNKRKRESESTQSSRATKRSRASAKAAAHMPSNEGTEGDDGDNASDGKASPKSGMPEADTRVEDANAQANDAQETSTRKAAESAATKRRTMKPPVPPTRRQPSRAVRGCPIVEANDEDE